MLGSLVAVSGDLRVLLLAAALSAAAAGLSSLNPDSIWNSSSSSGMPVPSTTAAAAGVYLWCQALLGVVGLRQVGADSPGVVGVGLLLGVALLVLLCAVGVSLGLKWCLDYCVAAVAAFNRWGLARLDGWFKGLGV